MPRSRGALPQKFYDRDPVDVARELLGAVLVSCGRDGITAGRIVEVEAYLSAGDPACHAARGRTRRNASMFAAPGTSYVYAIHSRWCFNVVTQPEGTPSAVLIRAIEPVRGLALMQRRRGVDKPLDVARGPARLCAALAIDKALDGHDLTLGRKLWIESADDAAPPPEQIVATPRIGISTAQDLLLRFVVADSPYISRHIPVNMRRS